LNSPRNPTDDAARAPWPLLGRGRAYFFAWLLSTFAIVALGLFDFAKKVMHGEAQPSALLGYVLFGSFVALLALPILFLLRIVPETSPSSPVRLVRRLFFGVLLGLLLGALLAALSAAVKRTDTNEETVQVLGLVGPLFGLIAGLVDSIALDGRARDGAVDGGDAPSS
jgi:uncharacterized membrane protein